MLLELDDLLKQMVILLSLNHFPHLVQHLPGHWYILKPGGSGASPHGLV